MSSLLIGGLATLALLSWTTSPQLALVKKTHSTPVLAQVSQDKQKISPSLLPCLPRGKQYKSFKLEGTTQNQGDRYSLVSFIEEKESIFENDPEPLIINLTTVILEDDLGCLVKMPSSLSVTHSMTLFVPEAVANQLALISVTNQIQKAVGKDKYIQSFKNAPRDAGDGPWIFFPEDVWAYRQLGIPLPQPSVVGKTWEDLGYQMDNVDNYRDYGP
ncbi:MAG: hypothetical protein ACRDEA_01275 [Microcystaceae cyanobacterium]